MEACQSGLTYFFAKEVGALTPLEGSNPSASATTGKDSWELSESDVGARVGGFESRSATARGGVAKFFTRKVFVTESLPAGRQASASATTGKLRNNLCAIRATLGVDWDFA